MRLDSISEEPDKRMQRGAKRVVGSLIVRRCPLLYGQVSSAAMRGAAEVAQAAVGEHNKPRTCHQGPPKSLRNDRIGQ